MMIFPKCVSHVWEKTRSRLGPKPYFVAFAKIDAHLHCTPSSPPPPVLILNESDTRKNMVELSKK